MRANTIETILGRLIHREPTVLDTGCWEWPGRRCTGHYGQVSMSCKLVMVHRVIYQHLRGPVPDDKELDHRCRNRICANPDHLRLVTRRQNAAHPRPYTPPPRIEKTTYRSCPHGLDRVTHCHHCKREYVNQAARRRAAERPPITVCRNGHTLTGDNLVLLAHCGRGTTRRCRICLSAAGKRGGYPSQERNKAGRCRRRRWTATGHDPSQAR